ncbi:class I SAM-dependent methyltransferase [Thiothrix fructosivorans]|uniref:Methyltransferase domain-containing protein n=1 Tax=Thiothrix fructosivorans TaxID=111770 RepID=A0A8B0SGJ9_9GAMM|nr:class I SAM-dependent methyltransferase [Thiothrix fructosivorans]MBO0615188.1 methyltransferase domain-containing protein [Thiothrix fructosivorans]QTX09975.1 methyltransferase domain-containing protein [Thiothrix fructosivorans]
MDEFTLTWQSTVTTHCDRLFANSIPKASELLEGAAIVTLPRAQFHGKQRHLTIEPKVGRFYPHAYAWEALDCSRSDFRPFRVIAATPDTLTVDPNHPLTAYALTINAPVAADQQAVMALFKAQGAGMQAPYPDIAPNYYAVYPFTRKDDHADAAFYSHPRLVAHLDKTALAQVTALYGRLLQTGMHVLDLMSSCVSHLPDTLDVQVTGLGMNAAELAANPRLQQHIVHDLNHTPLLPFADASFDAVICTVSVEYLTQPLAVMSELARVVKAGGVVIMTFSTRWFPNKVIDVWTEMHPFERQGLVLDYFVKTGRFSDLHTESVRGLPRPLDDAHRRETAVSDPVFAVWGTVTAFL